MKKSKLMTVVMITMLVLVIPQALSARGASDRGGEYSIELKEKFEELVDAVEAGTLDKLDAIAGLREFQELNDRVNREEFQLMESCINSVDKDEMTPLEAQEKVASMIQTRERTQLKKEDQTETSEQIQADKENREETQTRDKDQTGDQDRDQTHKDATSGKN